MMGRLRFVRSLLAVSPAIALWPVAAAAQGSIQGSVTFWGDPGGGTQVQVAAISAPWTDPVATEIVGLNGPFSLVVPDGDYYVWAYLDRDGGFGDAEDEDVVVLWDGDGNGSWDTVTVSGSAVTGIDIDLGFVYVDADALGADDGSSWADAFTDLQDGIDLAVSGIEVWVAEGNYVPGTSRSDSFVPKPGVRVYGGFTGVETTRPQRDWNAHPTILSGEIGTAGTADNCYHVVNAATANPSAILDGVTITAGRADGNAPNDHGAGIQARGGGVTLANAVVSGNFASAFGGGSAALLGGTVKAYNTRFATNVAQFFEGGGYYANIASTQPQTLVNCVFTANYAWRGGGIMLTGVGPAPVMVNLSLAINTAGGEGGGLHTNSSQSIELTNSIFWDNVSNSGVGPQISAFGGTVAPTVNYAIVDGGWATGSNILDIDPSIADAELRLNLDSPAIDAGDNTAVPIDEHDVDGNHWTDEPVKRDRDFNQRFRNLPYIPNTGVAAPDEWPVDIGAYEAWDPALIFEHDFDSGDLDPWSAVVGAM